MARTGERLQIEYRVIHRDGRTVWLRDQGQLVVDESRKPVCVQGYMIDVTELKQSQALASAQSHLLEFIARGAALPEVLEQIARFVEERASADTARLDPAARPRRHASRQRRRAEHARLLERGRRGARDRPGRRLVRHGRLPARARQRRRRADRSALGRLPRTGGTRRTCAPAGRRPSSPPTRRCSARSRSTIACRTRWAGRCRARRDRDTPRRAGDRALALRGRRPRERGSLPRPLRERERADRHRHDGRADHPGEPGVRAGARLLARRADRLQPARLPDAHGRRGGAAGDRAQALGRGDGLDVRAGVRREGRQHRAARGLEPHDLRGRPPGRHPGHLPRHHRAQAGRDRAAPALGAEPPPLAARQPDRAAEPRELPPARRVRDRPAAPQRPAARRCC